MKFELEKKSGIIFHQTPKIICFSQTLYNLFNNLIVRLLSTVGYDACFLCVGWMLAEENKAYLDIPNNNNVNKLKKIA